MVGWSKDDAISYCIRIAEININHKCENAKEILEIYQDMLFTHKEDVFYQKIWNSVIYENLESVSELLFENSKDATKHLENEFIRQDMPDNLDEFMTCIDSLNNFIRKIHTAHVNVLNMCMNSIQEYIVKQLTKLYKKEITGPECLVRYIYPYADKFKIPSNASSLWLVPSIKAIIKGLTLNSSKRVILENCSFCQKEKASEAFAVQYTKYTYFILTVCNDCRDFKKYYPLCYLNDEEPVIELDIHENTVVF
jgi:hypothetical protein